MWLFLGIFWGLHELPATYIYTGTCIIHVYQITTSTSFDSSSPRKKSNFFRSRIKYQFVRTVFFLFARTFYFHGRILRGVSYRCFRFTIAASHKFVCIDSCVAGNLRQKLVDTSKKHSARVIYCLQSPFASALSQYMVIYNQSESCV